MTRSPLRTIAILFCLGCLSAAACAPSDERGADSGLPDADDGTDGTMDGDRGPDGDAEAPAFLPAEDYCQRTVDFFCTYYLRCGRMAVADLEACRVAFSETCQAIYQPRYEDLEAAGLLKLSAAGLAACRDHLAQVPCAEQVTDLDDACAAMWLGTQVAGEACSIGLESFVCAPGTACVVSMDLCGECRTVVGPGQACGVDLGTTCGPAGSCDLGICLARQMAGEACAPGDICQLGTRCQADGVCRDDPWVGLGESCDATHSCAYHSHCSGGICVADLLLGAACTSADRCASGRCLAGSCQPLAAAGQACQAGRDCSPGFCQDGACVPGPSVCLSGG